MGVHGWEIQWAQKLILRTGNGARIAYNLDLGGWVQPGQLVIEKAGKIQEKGMSTSVQNEEKAVCGEQQGVAEESIRRQKRKAALSHILPANQSQVIDCRSECQQPKVKLIQDNRRPLDKKRIFLNRTVKM